MDYVIIDYIIIILNALDKMANCMKFKIVKS